MRHILWISLLCICILLLPHVSLAQGMVPPCRFYGSVTLDGDYVPDGTIIVLEIKGDEYQTVTPAVYGTSWFDIIVVPDEGLMYSPGTEVFFRVGNVSANQTAFWQTGGNVRIDLIATTPPPPTPTPPPTPSPTPPPTAAPTPTVEPTPVITPQPSPTPITPTPSPVPGALPNLWTPLITASLISALVVSAMVTGYVVWKYRFHRRPTQKQGR